MPFIIYVLTIEYKITNLGSTIAFLCPLDLYLEFQSLSIYLFSPLGGHKGF